MSRYRITNLAVRDIEEIWDYTISQWSLKQAEMYTNALFLCFESIVDREILGKPVDYLRQGYKKVFYGKHIIFFRIATDGLVEIIRVLHQSMDIENRLWDDY